MRLVLISCQVAAYQSAFDPNQVGIVISARSFPRGHRGDRNSIPLAKRPVNSVYQIRTGLPGFRKSDQVHTLADMEGSGVSGLGA